MYSTYLTLFDNFGILRKVGLWVRDIQYHPMIVGQDIFAAAANLRSICPHFCDGAKSRTQPDSVGLSRTQLENTEVDIKQVGNFLGEAWLADFDGCVWVTDLMRCTQCALCIISIHRTYLPSCFFVSQSVHEESTFKSNGMAPRAPGSLFHQRLTFQWHFESPGFSTGHLFARSSPDNSTHLEHENMRILMW